MSNFLTILASLGIGAVVALCPCCGAKASKDAAPALAAPNSTTVTLAVDGMTCASCSVAVRHTLKRLDGVREVRVSVEEKRVIVEYESGKVTPEQMIAAVNDLGYTASLAPKPN